MTNADQPFGVGLIGCSPTSRFICERLSLRSDLRLVAAWTGDEPTGAGRLDLTNVTPTGCRRYLTPLDVMKAPEVRVLHFAAGSPGDWMEEALARAKSIIVEVPHTLPPDELERLARIADSCSQVAAIYEPRRWDGDFLQARSALESGRLGRLLRLRYSVHDCRLPNEKFSRGVVRELGSHLLDQMLQLIEPHALAVPGTSVPSVWRHFPSARDPSEGFVASFEFAEDVSAIIEIQTRSLLGFRSGWMLEGTDGAYRHGRLYTRTADGEIVDEPLLLSPASSDPFFDALSAELRGVTTDLPTVREAIRVAALLGEMPTETQWPHGIALPASNRATAWAHADSARPGES